MSRNRNLSVGKERKDAGRVLFLAILWNGAAACTPHSLSSEAPENRILEMRSDIVRIAFPIRDRSIAWIDDEQVLFEGWDKVLKDSEASTEERVPGPRRGLYIWNIRTTEVTRYTKEPLRAPLCLADGYISYAVARGGESVRLEGEFGSERSVKPSALETRRSQVNRFTCRSYDFASLPRPMVGGGIEPLRPEHGWLEQTGSATWFRSPSDTLTLLTHEGRPIGPVRPQKYSPVSGKYVFWRPSDNKTWLINGLGGTELQPLPSDPLQRGSLEPSSGGLLLRSTQINARANWDPGASGLYIYQDPAKARRLVSGLVHGMQVHPAGCLIAVIVDPWNSRTREFQLKALNGCQQQGHVGK